MTQEFHLSVTPIRDNDYLVRTEQVAPDVPLAEEQVTWHVDDWLMEASLLMDDPLMGLLRSGAESGSLDRVSARFQSSSPRSGKSAANLIAFGQRLYNSLFQGTIRDSWMMAQGIAQHQRERVRFRLGLKGTNLHRLPWEVLYAGDRPLATGTEVIFSRYHSSFSVLKSQLPFPKRQSATGNQLLKILMVLAAPTDQEVLALKQEAEHLRQELQSNSQMGNSPFAGIELTILEQPGREQLTQALEHNHYQVLHYAGHSNLGASGGSLYLVNSRTGLTEILSGDDLAGLLVNNGIRMAVFNSCRGVYTANSDAASTGDGNLSEALVRRGIPAVLAMAERIPDDVALNLSRLFYRNLKQAYPIDLSLSRSRQGLISSYGSDQLYWALPILYLHPEFDGNLHANAVVSSGISLDDGTPGLYEDFYEDDSAPLPQGATALSNGRSPAGWQSNLQANGSAESLEDDYNDSLFQADDLPDPDDLDEVCEDPDPPEEETVARLVHELSHSPTLLESEEAILPAAATENLLPNSAAAPSGPYRSPLANLNYRQPGDSAQPTDSAHTPEPTAVNATDPKVYFELETVLAEMGKLTDEIAASNRAVQANPKDAQAYTDLGWALYQQGYLTEAISAYNQAIRLNPNLAIAYNRIGLAFYQQGKPDEAVRAYSRAVQLDPTMNEASTNLRSVLYEQTSGSPKPAPSAKVTPPKTPKKPARKPNKALLWGSLAAIALAALGCAWIFRDSWLKWLPASTPELSPSPQGNGNSSQSTPALVEQAAQQFNQNNLPAAQQSVEALLTRGALQEADSVLKAVPSQSTETAPVHFLKGRLAWQRWLLGDKNYSLETVRQLWDKAASAQPTALYENSLGFAYYALGKFDRAEQSWTDALKLSTAAPEAQTENAALKPEALTSYAGLALTAMKQAENEPQADKQALLRNEALKRRQLVITSDRVNFQPEVLSKNWMWSETAIQDWRSLLEMK